MANTPLDRLPDNAVVLINGEKLNIYIDALNKLINPSVRIEANGASRLDMSGQNAALIISLRDIKLGAVSGAKGGNAALASLINAFAAAGIVSDSTT